MEKILSEQISNKMIIVPFAGGSSQSFLYWQDELKDIANLKILDYAGHGVRLGEKVASDFGELVEDLVNQIKKYATDSTILFGYSLGGLACAYAAEECYTKYNIKFKGVILSSCLSPKKLGEVKHVVMTDEQINEYLISERNIPLDILKTKEFKKFLFPVIKNDFKIIHDYKFKHLILPPCPIHCIYAEQDYDIDMEAMSGWQEFSQSPIEWHSICGNHFYFEEYPAETFALIRDILALL